MSISEWFSFWMLIVTTIILIIGWLQLSQFKRDKKVEFTYKVYMDFFNFLNEGKNTDLKNWLFGDEKIPETEYIRLGDLFEKFESVYALLIQNSLDETVFYELISYYIEKVFAAKNPSAKDFIEFVRKDDEPKIGGPTSDIFQGTEKLYEKVKKIRSKRSKKSIFRL